MLSPSKLTNKVLIIGYTRRISTLLNQPIPNEINQLCFKFYYHYYIGLTNQGATDYLNCVIQCLYITPEFRQSLFNWKYKPPPNTKFDFQFKTEETDNKHFYKNERLPSLMAPPQYCITFQLQCLFMRLHKSIKTACSTQSLTKSFHWDQSQLFQHARGIQEIIRVLLDAISRAVGDSFENMFKGILLDYLECQVCHSNRFREDIFVDLSVTIRDINNLEHALKAFFSSELLDGNNQVTCRKCNIKQDFRRGYKFKKVPPILLIHLKRFEFDWRIERRVKLNHKLTFPSQLDLIEFMDDKILTEIKNTNDLKYTLYAVVLHSGGALGGHNFAFIKPFGDAKWYSFNDSQVRQLRENEFEIAYGGTDTKYCSGYYLLYRQTNLKMPQNYGYCPPYLISMMEYENKQYEINNK